MIKAIGNGRRIKPLAAALSLCFLLLLCATACSESGRGLREVENAVRDYADAIEAKQYGEAWDLVFSDEQGAFLSRDVFIASYENAGVPITGREISVIDAPTEETASASGQLAEPEDMSMEETDREEMYRLSVEFFTQDGSRLANDYIEFEVPKAELDAGGWKLQPQRAVVKDVTVEAPTDATVTLDGVAVEANGEAWGTVYEVPEIFKGAHSLKVEAPGYLEYKKIVNIMDDGQEIDPVYHLDGDALIEIQKDAQVILSGIYGQIDGKEVPAECLALFTDPVLAEEFDLSLYTGMKYTAYSDAKVSDVSVMPAEYMHDVGEYAVEVDFRLAYTEAPAGEKGNATQMEELLSYEFSFLFEDGEWLVDAVYPIY